jgi:hypothetical protein
MAAASPGIFERLPAWTSNPYRVVSGGPGARYTHRAYEAELDHIGREMPVLITEAGHLETGDEQEIARFYDEAFRDWMTDPKVVAATPLFWHPDRNDFWMFELDKNGAFKYKSPTYELLRKLPRVAGSPQYEVSIGNVPRTTRYEVGVAAAGAALPPARTGPQTTGPDTPIASDDAPDADEFDPTSPTPGRTRPSARHSVSGEPTTTQRAEPAMSRFRIANTGGEGARLRAEPSTAAEALAVLPDDAIVEALGPEQSAGGQAWRRVRTVNGQVGWVAGALLTEAASGDAGE